MSLDFGFEGVSVAFETLAELESIWQSKFFIRNEKPQRGPVKIRPEKIETDREPQI
jgi:hypothetical protein